MRLLRKNQHRQRRIIIFPSKKTIEITSCRCLFTVVCFLTILTLVALSLSTSCQKYGMQLSTTTIPKEYLENIVLNASTNISCRFANHHSASLSTTITTTTPNQDAEKSTLVPDEMKMRQKDDDDGVNVDPNRPSLPNILLIGVQKGGTTAMAEWLYSEHGGGVCRPEVFKGDPSYAKKEVHFFDSPSSFRKGIEFYTKRFEHCYRREQQTESNATSNSNYLALDATPNYLHLAKRIHSFYKHYLFTTTTANPNKNKSSVSSSSLFNDLKVLIILREPISREFSLYRMERRTYLDNPNPNAWYGRIAYQNGTMMKSFDEYLHQYLLPCFSESRPPRHRKVCRPDWGRYVKHIRPWFQLFNQSSQVLVLSYDELQVSPQSTLTRVAQFLNLQEFNISSWKTKQQSNAPSSGISCAAQTMLRPIFEQTNEELYELLELYPGRPSMESSPFPKFQLEECV